jgi:hypothetical protein
MLRHLLEERSLLERFHDKQGPSPVEKPHEIVARQNGGISFEWTKENIALLKSLSDRTAQGAWGAHPDSFSSGFGSSKDVQAMLQGFSIVDKSQGAHSSDTKPGDAKRSPATPVETNHGQAKPGTAEAGRAESGTVVHVNVESKTGAHAKRESGRLHPEKEDFGHAKSGRDEGSDHHGNEGQDRTGKDGPTKSSSFDATVTGWGNSHNAHSKKDSDDIIGKMGQMEKEGVKYLGMEFLDKKGEAIAQRYLDARAAHRPEAEQSADRRELLDYLKGQYDSRQDRGSNAEDMVKVIEAAGDHQMRIVGLEPGVDHLYSATSGFREVHAGLRQMTGEQRDSLSKYLDPNASDSERAEPRGNLDERLRGAGWDQSRRDDFFHKLDEMRQGDPPLKLPADLRLPPDKDTDQHPDQAWSALKQEWRNATWARRIAETVGDPQHPSGKMVVYAAPGHFEPSRASNAMMARVGQSHLPPGTSLLPDELGRLGINSYHTFPTTAERESQGQH